jgi:arylsulfatase A-like enzyme
LATRGGSRSRSNPGKRILKEIDLMRRLLMLILVLAATIGLSRSGHAAERRPNILLIAADDLNDWVGCLGGHPQALTPHIDRLARRGTLFTNAHCQAPLCNPSRSSLLTGLRPTTTGIYGLAPGIRKVPSLKDHVTLPRHFGDSGYFTSTSGKIFHDGSLAPAERIHNRQEGIWYWEGEPIVPGEGDQEPVAPKDAR